MYPAWIHPPGKAMEERLTQHLALHLLSGPVQSSTKLSDRARIAHYRHKASAKLRDEQQTLTTSVL